MWECHSNPEGQLNLQKCSCSCSHKLEKFLFSCLWPCCAGWGCGTLGVGGVLLSGGARCSPREGAEPPEGMEPAGTLWAGSPCSAHLPLSQGRLICTWGPCLVPPHLPGQQGQAAGLCSLPGDVRAAEGISPPRCAPRAGHSSSPALPAWEATSALQKPWQQRAGSWRRAEPAWET